jgi:hypothetical protein
VETALDAMASLRLLYQAKLRLFDIQPMDDDDDMTTMTTASSTVLLVKLTIAQLVKNSSASYGTRRFITILIRARHRASF